MGWDRLVLLFSNKMQLVVEHLHLIHLKTSGTAPTLSTADGSVDTLGYMIVAPNEILLSTAQLAFA